MRLYFSFISIFASLLMSYSIYAQKNPGDLKLLWDTDTSNTSVPLSEFTALMYPDGIPPIDAPAYYSIEQARKEYFEFEPVIVVEINGEGRAYPLSVLMYHEIANDSLGGKGITITFCPLCNSALVFERDLNFKGKDYHLDFGVSGMLRKSDMVMYDRQTETWWQQFTGEGLVGELQGAELGLVSAPLLSLDEFIELYPSGTVLAKERNSDQEDRHHYGENPYVGYDDHGNEKPRLFFDEVDARFPAMTRVIDVLINKKHKIFRLNYLRDKRVLNDDFQGESFAIFYTEKLVSVLDSADITESKTIGAVNVFYTQLDDYLLTFKKKKGYFMDKQTKSKWNMKGVCYSGKLEGTKLRTVKHGTHFAFAMFAFHPDTEVYKE